MHLLLDVPPGDLPPPYRALVDPDQPLQAPERFCPAERAGGWFGYCVLVGCLGLFAILAERLVPMVTGAAEPNSVVLFLSPVCMLILAYVMWRTVVSIGLGRRQVRDQQTGRYRLGMFIEPDALLFYDGTDCVLVPRKCIKDIERRSSYSNGFMGYYVAFRDAQGTEQARRLPHPRCIHVTEEWMRTGKLPTQAL